MGGCEGDGRSSGTRLSFGQGVLATVAGVLVGVLGWFLLRDYHVGKVVPRADVAECFKVALDGQGFVNGWYRAPFACASGGVFCMIVPTNMPAATAKRVTRGFDLCVVPPRPKRPAGWPGP